MSEGVSEWVSEGVSESECECTYQHTHAHTHTHTHTQTDTHTHTHLSGSRKSDCKSRVDSLGERAGVEGAGLAAAE